MSWFGSQIWIQYFGIEILTNGNLVTGIEIAGGKQITSDIVVANSDAEYVYNKLLDKKVSNAKGERRKLKVATKSLAGFSLLLGLDNSKGDSVVLDHHNVYFLKIMTLSLIKFYPENSS